MSKKQHLIPFENSKRVISLDNRGRKREPISIGSIFFAILGLLCVAYCFFVAFFMNYGTTFFLLWGVLGLLSIVTAVILSKKALTHRIPKGVRIAVAVLFGIGVIIFLWIEALIISRFQDVPETEVDYVVILGAQWKESGPSVVLRQRLDKAVKYLEQNPNTKVLVSGGKGTDEPIPEAQGMCSYLVDAGIDAERIIQEDKSTNTLENLKYCAQLIDEQTATVAIVTNNFHVFRAEKIAKRLGYEKVCGIAADSSLGMLPNNMLREFLAILKDFWIGNM